MNLHLPFRLDAWLLIAQSPVFSNHRACRFQLRCGASRLRGFQQLTGFNVSVDFRLLTVHVAGDDKVVFQDLQSLPGDHINRQQTVGHGQSPQNMAAILTIDMLPGL